MMDPRFAELDREIALLNESETHIRPAHGRGKYNSTQPCRCDKCTADSAAYQTSRQAKLRANRAHCQHEQWRTKGNSEEVCANCLKWRRVNRVA